MAFANLEDLTGKIECVIFPKTYAEFDELLEEDGPFVIKGEVRLNEEPRKIFPIKIQKLKDELEEKVSAVWVNIPMENLTEHRLARFKQTLLSYRGSVPMKLVFNHNEGRAVMPLSETFLINPTPQMAAKINDIFQNDSVKFIKEGRAFDPSEV